jgi:hypothetical protein
MIVALSFAADIRPLFSDQDVSCMKPRGVELADSQWMCDPAHAQRVYDSVRTGFMPPGESWPPERVATFKQWMDEGCKA